MKQLEPQDLSNIIELAKSNDKSFYLKFSELYPKFNQQLLALNQQLTPRDLEYCALIKLNFDTKEIAQIKNMSIGSVESRKYRIRKKLDIGTQENMYVWFINL
ncbi:helix-turn-helix transcriptional regulator [Chryseobacterium sp. SIMBA_029]|uniref:helix-turn-helix transcriptional regulator n=1 Tax=Chryseobacterium sp. SIMBA_029 TaxID=3085772 RepID=UPI00397DA6E9